MPDTKLQIISGKFKGKKLHLPEGARPTQQKARGAVFNMLSEIIGLGPAVRVREPSPRDDNWTVWDAFAGSGALGIEFISRFGAKRAIFTDTDPEAIACIKENTKNITDCEIVVRKPLARFDSVEGNLIIFIDPPYSAAKLGEKLIAELEANAPAGTIVVWEIENNEELIMNNEQWATLKDKTHGRARFLVLQKI